jgi:dienelactone hydrolase
LLGGKAARVSAAPGSRFDSPGGELWHYNNAWFASRGYVVLTYTARGFVDGQNRGSTGQTQLDSRSFEINDFQDLACQATELFNAAPTLPDVDPSKVVATGGSYGGGFSWMALCPP